MRFVKGVRFDEFGSCDWKSKALDQKFNFSQGYMLDECGYMPEGQGHLAEDCGYMQDSSVICHLHAGAVRSYDRLAPLCVEHNDFTIHCIFLDLQIFCDIYC